MTEKVETKTKQTKRSSYFAATRDGKVLTLVTHGFDTAKKLHADLRENIQKHKIAGDVALVTVRVMDSYRVRTKVKTVLERVEETKGGE